LDGLPQSVRDVSAWRGCGGGVVRIRDHSKW
jgi:hypothetical protein